MTIAIVGDTHMPKGKRRLPERALELLRASDLIVHTGDFTGIEALELFAAIGPPLVAVAGNVDEPAVHEVLPAETTFTVGESARVGLVHDAGPRAGRLARMRRRFPEADAVLFGHSHLPLHERADEADPGSFQIFNPGSPTERRRAPRHSMGVAELSPAGDLELRHVWLG
jgi:putative phosphoesterase